MDEIKPLTAEEIDTIRGILGRRKYLLTGIFTGLGAALAGLIWKTVTGG